MVPTGSHYPLSGLVTGLAKSPLVFICSMCKTANCSSLAFEDYVSPGPRKGVGVDPYGGAD